MELLHNPVFLLLVIVVLGETLGKLRFGSFSLGTPAIIFVALAFGHNGYTLPPAVQTAGVALFIYSVGLQAGPGFVSSFRSHGLALGLTVLAMALIGALVVIVATAICGFDAGTSAGLLAGAMTSTPALAAAVEVVGPGSAPAAYGVTYGFGVLGVALAVKLLPRLARVSVPAEEARLEKELAEANPPITFHHLEVTNPNLFGKRVAELRIQSIAPVTLTRLLRRGASEPELVGGDTVLGEGDRIRVVGRPADLERIELFLGRPVSGEIAFDRVLTKAAIVVSKPKYAGNTLGFFNVREVFNAQIARITRNGIDLPADANTRLHLGDVLHAVGDERSLRNLAKILGNDVKATWEINLVPILLGLLFGFLLGQFTLPLPLIGDFTLGTTGGVLLAGLVLGSRYQTGPLIWEIPEAGNRLLRDLGLMFFLAAVGTSAGTTLAATLAKYGLPLLLAGVAVTLIPLALGAVIGLKFLGIRFLRLLGVLVGGMTSASGLAAASSLSATPYAAAAYATVYPVALIGKILAVKLLLLVLA